MQQHLQVLNRNGSMELYRGSQSSSTEAPCGMGPKLLKPVQGMLHGDETGDGSEISSKLSGGCELFDKSFAHEVNGIHDKWFVLSLKLTDQEAEDALDPVSPFPVTKQESSAGSGTFIKLLPAWNRGLHESFRQQKRAKRRSMRGVSARMNEKVKDNTCLQPLIIVPSSPKRVSWTFLGFVFILWDLVTIPMTMFDIPGFSDFLDLMGRVTFGYFLMDVFLHFIFAVDIKGQLEMRPGVIARTYVRSWFFLDVLLLLIDVMLFTLEAIATGGDAMSGLKTMRLLRSLRLLRLMRLLRIGKLKEVLQILANRFSSLYFLMILKILSGFGMVLAVNHFIACSWYGVGLIHVDTVSWLTESQMQEASFAEGYITAMHWSLTQFTPATNNVAPANYLERMVAVFVILLAMGVFSSFVSSITSAVNSLRAVRMEQIKQETKIRQFFSERNLSAELFNKVQDVCRKRGLFEIRLKEEEVALLKEIPESLKRRLHEEIFLPLLSIAPFLPPWSHSQEYRFMRKVCHVAMQERSALSSQDVFVLGADCKEMIMVQYGAMGYHAWASQKKRVTLGWVCSGWRWLRSLPRSAEDDTGCWGYLGAVLLFDCSQCQLS
ncbi:KCNH2 [Symbiodinium microadriaticum]|nr:KCNH2 [Symbiodinium microadriaticum]